MWALWNGFQMKTLKKYLFYFKILNFMLYIYIYMDIYVLCLHMCLYMHAWYPEKSKEGVRSPRTGVTAGLWDIMQVLRIEPRSSVRVAGALTTEPPLQSKYLPCLNDAQDTKDQFCLCQPTQGLTESLAFLICIF